MDKISLSGYSFLTSDMTAQSERENIHEMELRTAERYELAQRPFNGRNLLDNILANAQSRQSLLFEQTLINLGATFGQENKECSLLVPYERQTRDVPLARILFNR